MSYFFELVVGIGGAGLLLFIIGALIAIVGIDIHEGDYGMAALALVITLLSVGGSGMIIMTLMKG